MLLRQTYSNQQYIQAGHIFAINFNAKSLTGELKSKNATHANKRAFLAYNFARIEASFIRRAIFRV